MTLEERYNLYKPLLNNYGYSDEDLEEYTDETKQKLVETIDDYLIKKNQEMFAKGAKILADYEKVAAFLYLQTYNIQNNEDALKIIAAGKQAEYGLINSMYELLGEERFKKIFMEES